MSYIQTIGSLLSISPSIKCGVKKFCKKSNYLPISENMSVSDQPWLWDRLGEDPESRSVAVRRGLKHCHAEPTTSPTVVVPLRLSEYPNGKMSCISFCWMNGLALANCMNLWYVSQTWLLREGGDGMVAAVVFVFGNMHIHWFFIHWFFLFQAMVNINKTTKT